MCAGRIIIHAIKNAGTLKHCNQRCSVGKMPDHHVNAQAGHSTPLINTDCIIATHCDDSSQSMCFSVPIDANKMLALTQSFYSNSKLLGLS